MNLKKTAITLIIVTASFFAWNQERFAKTSLACEEPITYMVGAFDRRFGISQKYFLDALGEAEAIWEEPLDMEFFVYAPESSGMAVNLIYDYRQEVTSTLSGLEGVVEEDEATYQALRVKYVGLKTEYNSAKGIYDAHVREFNEQNALYQRQVESWNKSKRNSKEQFERLEADRKTLEAAIAELQLREAELNETAREINTLVGTLNRLAKSLNLNVETYNTIGASRGETFTGGVYRSTEGVQEINIYEFSSRGKLVRILAHELGHALGLEHLDDQEAMMYRLNEGDAGVLSEADLAALRTLCRVK